MFHLRSITFLRDYNGYLLAIVLFTFKSFVSCKNSETKIGSRFENGTVNIVYEFPTKGDTLNYTMKIYYPNGKIRKVATVMNGKYCGKVFTYTSTGKIYEIDSIIEPCPVNPGRCNAILTRYYENGKISQRYTVAEGKLNGLTQQYTEKGNLAKSYYLIDDSIKNGEYKEFYDNGNVARKATFYMDTLIGTDYFFKEYGDTLKYYQHYPWGKGFPAKEFHDDGSALTVDYAGKNSKGVVWKWFDNSGKLIKQKFEYPVNGVYKKPQ